MSTDPAGAAWQSLGLRHAQITVKVEDPIKLGVPAAAAVVMLFVFVHRKPAVAPVSPVSINRPAAPYLEQVVPPQPEEIVTDFFPLMDPAPPFGRGKILRVELPASAMGMVGLPVNEQHLADSVQADVLVGEEGLPRAIRFVKFEGK